MIPGWALAIIVLAALAAGWFGRYVYDGCLILRHNRESYEKGRADERAARAFLADQAGNSDQLDRETPAPAVLEVPVSPPVAAGPEALGVPDAAGADLPEQRDWEPGELRRMREEIDAEGGYADFSSRLSAFISERDQWLTDTRAELADDRQRLGLAPFTVTGEFGKVLAQMDEYRGGRHARR